MKGATIVSDGYPSYPSAVQRISCEHVIVSHNEGFVNVDGENTNKIENLWSHLKSELRSRHGVPYTHIDYFLKQFSFKKKYLANSTNNERISVFIRICQLIFSDY
ncbi:hypothetical protein DMUE_0805 [Dictyocoela muelleri]|nr:hypothetical protein DMUE_0805 [Dictyocoela muelleri]